MTSDGTVWLFGGSTYAFAPGSLIKYKYLRTSGASVFNDLWKWNGNQWAWVSGYNIKDYYGSYGMKGVSSSSNIIPKRDGNAGWIDSQGNPWIFGGYGFSATSQCT